MSDWVSYNPYGVGGVTVRVRNKAAVLGRPFGAEYDVVLDPHIETMIDSAIIELVGDQDLG